MSRTRPGALLLALVSVAAGALSPACGGAGATGDPIATTSVTMPKSYRFDPGSIEVRAGATVTWTNEDNFTHTVRVEGREDMKVEPGESISVRFDRPGTYHYVCTLHLHDMEGEVHVRPSA
jgi:plastocyanin